MKKKLNKKQNNKIKKINNKEDLIKKINNKEDIIEDNIKQNNKNKINNIKKIKTSIHDVMMIQLSIDNIKTQFINDNDITLTGDLGYLSSKKYKLNNKNISLITPKRKNQKNKNSDF